MNIISIDLTVKEAQEIKSKAELAYKQFCMWVKQLEKAGYIVQVISPNVLIQMNDKCTSPTIIASKDLYVEL